MTVTAPWPVIVMGHQSHVHVLVVIPVQVGCAPLCLQRLHTVHPDTIGMEMETFHLMHLAHCSKGVIVASGAAICVSGCDVALHAHINLSSVTVLCFHTRRTCSLPIDCSRTW